ncbi:hypothetical protein ACFWIB_37445 [Streptomyces sp. NPDC127051]|uniref:hypothetical protein n=1 Tax=Streptomyces sp. NPDC127051 TaxID=3347119 RepID=UPI0036523E6B
MSSLQIFSPPLLTTHLGSHPVRRRPTPCGADGVPGVQVERATGYLCVIHRSLAGPIGVVASALAAALAVALALRRR